MGDIFFNDNHYQDDEDSVELQSDSELERYLTSISAQPQRPAISEDDEDWLEKILATFEE